MGKWDLESLNAYRSASKPIATYNIDVPKPIAPALKKYTKDEWGKMNLFEKIKVGNEEKKKGNYDYAPREELYNDEVNKQANSKIGSAIAGFTNAASLGTMEAGAKAQTRAFNAPNVFEESAVKNPLTYNIGKVAGYVAPGVVGAGLTKPLLTKVTNPLLNRVAEGAIVGSGMTAIEDIALQKKPQDIGRDLALNAALGGALDVGLYGLGKAVKSAFPKWETTHFSEKPIELPKPIQETAITKPSIELNGKYKNKNTQLEKATKEYETAIEDIQNHFMTNKLTPDEISRIKPELGIDLNKLISNVEKYQVKPNLKEITDKAIYPYAAGLKEAPKTLKPTNLNPIELPNITASKEVAAAVNPSIGATDRTRSISQIVSSDNKTKLKPKEIFDRAYTRFVDINNPIKKVDENTFIKATNSKNVGGTVDYILQNDLVDRQGKKIGEGLKTIVKDIPKDKEESFYNYLFQKHNIDRAREGKPVYADFTPEQSMKAVGIIEQQNSEFKALGDRLTKFLRDFETEWGNKSGLISDELWQNLQDTYKSYIPTNRSFDELEQGFNSANGRGFVDQGNSLKKATGSDRDIINPVENIMNLVNKTVRTARYNEVGQSLLEAIRKNPALKEVAEILPTDEVINPNVKNVVTVLEGGKPVNVKIKNEALLQSLQAVNKSGLDTLDSTVKKATNLFKQLVTQKNPVFALRNIARDIPTAYINGSEMNPVKFTTDLLKAGKDLVTNSEKAQQYKAIGGGGSNFFNSGNVAKSAKELTKKTPLQKIADVIDTINNVTESAPRLAEFNRVLDKTGDVQKALFAANDVTTNFSRGGDISKKADAYIPYFNAGIQGLDKLARQFINKPVPTAAKGLIGITTATLVLDQVNKNNPNYHQLDNRTKDTYFLIPKEDGTFIKIPKAREYGVLFSDLFERSLRLNRGDNEAFKGIDNTLKNNFAINPLENIFTPLYNLKANKDFADRDIVPRSMQDLSSENQYDEKTSEIAKKLGEATKMSPKQIDYLIRSYTGVIGQLGLPAATKSNYNGNATGNLLKPITTQFIADPLYSNQTITDFYDNLDKATTKANDRNFKENIPSDRVTKEERLKNDLNKTAKAISDYNKKIREAEKNNNLDLIKELRIRMIEKASQANKLYNK